MTIKIGSNIASTQAQRRLGDATSSLSKIYERLSSGQRINTASDDAAGLAISTDLNSKSRIFSQGIRNINDGISVQNIADSAVSTLSDITVRLKELAEQSANGTYSNTQRKALDAEAQALAKEFFRVSRSAQFNGQKLFDGSMADGLRIQAGIGVEGSLLTQVGGDLGTGSISQFTQLTTESTRSHAIELGDLNMDGILDMVTVGDGGSGDGFATIRLGRGDGNFGNPVSLASAEDMSSRAIALGDLNGDGILDLVSTGYDDFFDGLTTVRLGRGDGSFGNATSFQSVSGRSFAVELGDLNDDGILDIVTAGGGASGSYSAVRLGTGSGSFNSVVSYSMGTTGDSYGLSLGDLNSDGILDMVTAGLGATDGIATIRLGNGNGTFASSSTYIMENKWSYATALGDLNGDGKLDLVTAG